MAIPTNIKTLLSGRVVEWARIEFKETWDAAASLKTVCAFANDLDNWGGGYIVIGVQEKDGRPQYPLKGVAPDRIDAYQKDILEKCKLIRPSYLPIAEVVEYNDRQFIILWCPGGDNRPYSAPKTMKKDNKERIHYIRKLSSTVEPSSDEERDLFSLANRIPFDDRVNHQAEITDLNITLVQEYLKEVNSSLYEKAMTGDFIEVCRDMNIICELPEYRKPKNVGLMFFSMEPDKFFPYTQIDVVMFPKGLGGDQIIEQTFKGPIHDMLRNALRYIKNMVVTEMVVKYPDRAEADRFFNYPYAAIEESLSNAVYHRAYDEREPIEVRVENDRIEILSFPGPDRSVTPEGLKNYRVTNRRYRNRRIGDFLKELHLTEGRNTGFKKILDALDRNGSPQPEFETDESRSYFITRLFIHEEFLKNDRLQESRSSGSQVAIDFTMAEDEKKTGQKNDRSLTEVMTEALTEVNMKKVAPLVKFIEENGQISPKEAAKLLGKSASTAYRYLSMLTQTGAIVKDGNTNNIVYRPA
ncbi:MAG: putative DNA binding domain-containing protein [Lachnospiraceae bacterium]|nr:putative DNA binding domain-containing protein [Lachnospiraceae bacterium]